MLGPALSVLGQTVTSAQAHKNGALAVSFAHGSRLSVAPDAEYEAWEMVTSAGCASCVRQEVASLSGMLSETVTRVPVTGKPERALPMALPPHGYEHLYASGEPR
jgi:hypothetical protein